MGLLGLMQAVSAQTPALLGVGQALSADDTYLASATDEAVVSPPDLSWPHIIDLLTAGPTIREFIHNRDKGMSEPPLKLKKVLKLEKISFKSCGYVEVPDGRFVASWPFGVEYSPSAERDWSSVSKENRKICTCTQFFMQVNTDRHLARVIQGIPVLEALSLRRVHGFTFGWGNGEIYDSAVIKAAKNDGIRSPGRGRFTGTVQGKPAPGTPPEIANVKRYEGIFYPKEETPEEEDPDVVPVNVFDTTPFDRDYDADQPGVFSQSRFESQAGYRTNLTPDGRDPGFPYSEGAELRPRF